MSESLSLLSEVGGVGGGGGGESGGVIDIVGPAGFWSMELVLPLLVDLSSTYSGLLWISIVDGPLEFFVRRSDSLISSKVVCGGGGAPSCVSKRKWILRREGVA